MNRKILKQRTSRTLIFAGIIIIVCGITRWWTIKGMIFEQEAIIDAVHKEYAIDVYKQEFTQKDMSNMAAVMRMKIALCRGPYQWVEGLISSVTLGIIICLVGVFMKSSEGRKLADNQGEKGS
jgi:hypothetical protein